MSKKLTPEEEDLGRAVLFAAKSVSTEAVLGALGGGPAIETGCMSNGTRSVVVIVAIGSTDEMREMFDDLGAPIERFCAKNGMTYRAIDFDRPGGA